jgi:hypothetical protein
VVPFGHEVPAFWSAKTCEPFSAAFLQQPWITPELSTGLGLDITAAVAIPDPAASTSVAAPAMMILRPIMVMFSPLTTRDATDVTRARRATAPDALSPLPLPSR